MATTYTGRNGAYEELALLSDKGGMALVYLCAEQGVPDHKVAVKTPRPGLPTEVGDLFLREAEAASRVAGPNVVALIDWGDSPPFIAYEYMSAGTLADEIRARQGGKQQWTPPELIELFVHLARGMDAINRHVVHRDLKPDNIFVAGTDLRIGDFGISKYVGEVTRSKTFKGWGTAAYMAPETFRTESVDWRADQYSLGVLFYEMAVLDRPFTGDWDALERAQLYEAPRRITATRTDLPERLASVIARMLEKRADKRFESWSDVVDELEASGAGTVEAGQEADAAGLGRRAAAALEAARARDLQAQQEGDTQATREQERDDTLAYWANEFFELIGNKVAYLNQALGQKAYALNIERPPGSKQRGTHLATVTFFNGIVKFSLHPSPLPNDSQALGWGLVDLRTWGRLWVGNLLLLAEPPPYGTWSQVDMKISGIMRSGATPERRGKGTYEILGQQRLVEATNWAFLQEQREMRTTMSVVDYSEKVLDFPKLVDELFDILTDDGPKEKPPPPRPRNPMSDFRFPDV